MDTPKLTLLTLLTLLTGTVIFFEPFQNLRFLHFLRRKLGCRSGILLTTTEYFVQTKRTKSN